MNGSHWPSASSCALPTWDGTSPDFSPRGLNEAALYAINVV